jgi:predicted MFS family arabinose efflux permease
MHELRNYCLVTAVYWSFTLTDGALRMLVLLHFHGLGYSPIQLAFLFLFYEFFGIVTNLVGGWVGSRLGLTVTLWAGTALQIVALLMLVGLDPHWSVAVSTAYVMAAQALSGIAKDLTKMSSKSAIKFLVPGDQQSSLFKWVALLTGSKNALKGVGFFLGGLLLAMMGFNPSLIAMAVALGVILLGSIILLPREIGKAKKKKAFAALFAKSRDINVLSAARFFLFGARDIWFVVGVPIFLSVSLGWSFTQVGSFLALWIVGYGIVQSVAPALISRWTAGKAPTGRAAMVLAFVLAGSMALIPLGLVGGVPASMTVLIGLGLFGVIFAINSSVHSYLILAYSHGDEVATNVGFYYMANAGGRLVGTLLSGIVYQLGGLEACLWTSVIFSLVAGAISCWLPRTETGLQLAGMAADGGGSD